MNSSCLSSPCSHRSAAVEASTADMIVQASPLPGACSFSQKQTSLAMRGHVRRTPARERRIAGTSTFSYPLTAGAVMSSSSVSSSAIKSELPAAFDGRLPFAKEPVLVVEGRVAGQEQEGPTAERAQPLVDEAQVPHLVPVVVLVEAGVLDGPISGWRRTHLVAVVCRSGRARLAAVESDGQHAERVRTHNTGDVSTCHGGEPRREVAAGNRVQQEGARACESA